MRRLLVMFVLSAIVCGAIAQDVIQLPVPNKKVETPLFQVLQQRRSVREYQQREVDDATLSQILWAACGISDEKTKKITAPSAINAQDIQIYVVKSTGAYLFNAESNILTKVSNKDLRTNVAGRQQMVANAPLMLILVSDLTKFRDIPTKTELGAIDAGCVSQNIYLACTALGLGTVARGTMDKDVLQKELGLDANHMLMLNHPIGWKK